MAKNLLCALCLSLITLVCAVPACFSEGFNPYLPMNAVAAYPPTPYNLWDYQKYSRSWVIPCPSCGRGSTLLPDMPTVYQSVRGPFQVAVPVP